jgi:glycosyltransferase involved in cell wall biosynthesis
MRKSRVWITWEIQRRSLNLSARLGAQQAIFDDENKGLIRYPLSALKTLWVLWKYRGGVVFVQFPSMFLAAQACLLKPLFRYTLVVDRHTDFSLELKPPYAWKDRLILRLSAFTLRKTDLTLVTNSEMAASVASQGGRSFVLPDPYPAFSPVPPQAPQKPLEILFVSTWADDEPLLEAMEACRLLGGEVRMYVSGKMKRKFEKAAQGAPSNFIPTGFLSDEKYFERMSRVDCVMAITTRPATLVCGAYEAISLGKPLLLGDSEVLREYFHQGALYTNGTASDIAAKLRELPGKLPALQEEIRQFRQQSQLEWEKRLDALNATLEKSGTP